MNTSSRFSVFFLTNKKIFKENFKIKSKILLELENKLIQFYEHLETIDLCRNLISRIEDKSFAAQKNLKVQFCSAEEPQGSLAGSKQINKIEQSGIKT